MLTIACFKWGTWGGGRGAEYVNRLYNGVWNHLVRPFRFVCFTDDPTGFDKGVIVRPMGPDWNWNLRKMWAYSPDAGLAGRVLLLDLDTLVTGSLSDIADYGGPFCDVEDFYEGQRLHGGAVVSFEAGSQIAARLWTPVVNQYEAINAAVNGSERYYYRMIMDQAGDRWQDILPGQVVSSKVHCADGIPDNARLVCFHGVPRPHDVDWDPTVRGIEFVNNQNPVSEEQICANIEAALARGLPEIGWQRPAIEDARVAIVGGAPSLKRTWPELVTFPGSVMALNNAHRFLVDQGVTPDYVALVDPRPDCARFVEDADPRITFLIASQCDPAVFDALAGHKAYVWHASLSLDYDQMLKGRLTIGGGYTIGTRAWMLATVMGAKHFHFYGMDSSYEGDSHHAYPQDLRDSKLETRITAHYYGERFETAGWMHQQVEVFKLILDRHKQQFETEFTIDVHGGGLLGTIVAHHPSARRETLSLCATA